MIHSILLYQKDLGPINWHIFQENGTLHLKCDKNLPIHRIQMKQLIMLLLPFKTLSRLQLLSLLYISTHAVTKRYPDSYKGKAHTRHEWQCWRLSWQRQQLNRLIRQVKDKLDEHRYNNYQYYIYLIYRPMTILYGELWNIFCEPTIIPPLQVNDQTYSSDTKNIML